MKMSNLKSHLRVVFRHKREVYKAMKACGKPMQGLLHDLSKFSPTEFIESVKYFQGNRSPIEACKEDKGYSMAWFHHRGHNPHHSQFWCDISFGEVKPCNMPWKYLLELICDGIAAGKIYQGDKWTKNVPLDYWIKRDSKSFYSDNDRNKLLWYYTKISEVGWEDVANSIKKHGDIYLLEVTT